MSTPSPWSRPKHILLATYYRIDHAVTTRQQGIVGLPVHDRGIAAKINDLAIGDWVLIRVSEFGTEYKELVVIGPARIVDRPLLEKTGSPNSHRWPTLLWPEEVETGRLIYPYRIPVTFEGGPKIPLGCFTWDILQELHFQSADGRALESPQQWGIKFSGTVVDRKTEVAALTALIEACQTRA